MKFSQTWAMVLVILLGSGASLAAEPTAHARSKITASPTQSPKDASWQSSWSFRFALDAKGQPLRDGELSPKAFGYGICKGSFQNLAKQGHYLVWGAQSSCTASNNFFYLHQVRVELYDSCLYGLCVFFEKTKTIFSSAASNYSRVATVNGHDFCKGSKVANSRTYEQRVYVTIRDIEFGPFAQQAGVLRCDITP